MVFTLLLCVTLYQLVCVWPPRSLGGGCGGDGMPRGVSHKQDNSMPTKTPQCCLYVSYQYYMPVPNTV